MSAFRLDPHHMVAVARRQLAGTPVQLADGFARLVRRSTDERLERIMRTPARRMILDGIFWQMPQHLDRQRAAGMDAAIEWRITGRADGGADVYRLTIAGGRARARRGSTPEGARVTITLPGPEFLRLATGLIDPMQAYFGGKIKLAGDIMFAASLQSLFRIPMASRRP